MRKPRIGLVTIVVVIVTGVLFLLFAERAPRNATVSKAQLGAKALADACEAYALNPGSGGAYPNALADLLDSSFKGPWLKNGEQDLFDPWGERYAYELRTRSDGTPFAFVHTKMPDGTVISQYGVGSMAEPKLP